MNEEQRQAYEWADQDGVKEGDEEWAGEGDEGDGATLLFTEGGDLARFEPFVYFGSTGGYLTLVKRTGNVATLILSTEEIERLATVLMGCVHNQKVGV